MLVQWYGQAAFRLEGIAQTVFLDPFGDMSAVAGRGLRFDYPPISGVRADLVLITHEHRDHNAAEAIAGQPAVLRSTAGRLPSPLGEVVAVASEHDDAAGTERGPNTIFVFTLDGLRVAHLGDLGQEQLREEQARAIGRVDLLLAPVGAGPTIGGAQAAAIARLLEARWVVPMHYRTERVNFLEPLDETRAHLPRVHELPGPQFEVAALPDGDGPLLVVPGVP